MRRRGEEGGRMGKEVRGDEEKEKGRGTERKAERKTKHDSEETKRKSFRA